MKRLGWYLALFSVVAMTTDTGAASKARDRDARTTDYRVGAHTTWLDRTPVKPIVGDPDKPGSGMVDVIVHFDRASSQVATRKTADRFDREFRINREFSNFAMKAMTIPVSRLQELRERPGVKYVVRDAEVSSFSKAGRATANTPPIGGYYDYHYSGNGFSVAVVDSGVGNHPDLDVVRQVDFVGKYNTPFDPWGHGTHVAGMISGEGGASRYVHWGQAYKADIVALRVLDDDGRGQVSSVIAALDWMIDNKDTYNIRVANLSIGKAVEEAAAMDPLVQAVEQAWDAGIAMVCSAGNYGRDGNFTITSPGNSPKCITVGSITDNGNSATADDYVSSYSSKGPTLYDHFLKPDLLAPGNRVVSTMAAEAAMLNVYSHRKAACGSYTCQADYLELSGTSMSTAMVSGAAIRMVSRDPSISPDTVKARLMKSARKIDGDPAAVGAGVLDITAALDASGHVTGTALSPKLAISDQGVVVQNTAYLWGDAQWSLAYIWDDAYMWSDAFIWDDAFLWDDAYIWQDAYIWNDAFMWSDAYIWNDAVPNQDPLYQSSTESMSLRDDNGSSGIDDSVPNR